MATSKDEVFLVSGYRFRIRVDVIKCESCERVYLSSESHDKMERTIARFLADEGTATPETFRFMRRALGLSVSEAAMVFGTTIATLESWESDDGVVDRRAFATLRDLVKEQLGPRQRTRGADSRASIRIDLRQSLS